MTVRRTANFMPVEDRIRAKSIEDPRTGCWEWQASLNRAGYGQINVGGTCRLAHRVAYEAFKGPVPPGRQIDHLCRNRRCVNPDHLEAVTPRENTLRGESSAAARARQTHCKRGHEFTPENTLTNNGGWRLCRECKRQRALISTRRRRGRPAPTVEELSHRQRPIPKETPAA